MTKQDRQGSLSQVAFILHTGFTVSGVTRQGAGSQDREREGRQEAGREEVESKRHDMLTRFMYPDFMPRAERW